MRKIITYSFFVVLLVLGGCVNLKLDNRLAIDEKDWYTEGGNDARHHRIATTVDPPLIESWRYDVGAGVGLSGALVIDGVILVGTRKGHIVALDIETGKRLGRARFEAPIEGGMSYNNSMLYLPFIDKKRAIIAYDINDGDQIWRAEGAPVESTILAKDSVIVIVDSDALVRGLDPLRGEVLWEKHIGERTGIVASPVAINDNVVVATEQGVVHMIDPDSGDELWQYQLSAPVYSTPTVQGQSIFVSTTRGKIYSLKNNDGSVNWIHSLADSTVRLAGAGYDLRREQLVVGGSDGLVRSLNPKSGEENWVTPLEGAIIIAPLFTNNTIYIGTLRGMLYALDRNTGEKIWEHKVTGRIKSHIVAHEEKIVVMAETQQLFVFEQEKQEDASLSQNLETNRH